MFKIRQVVHFLSEDLWRIRLEEQQPPKSFLIKVLRILVLSAKGFDKDKCTLRASALTFYSLLSIVPILAMAFGIAKGFGFDQILEQRVREQFHGQEEVLTHAINFAHNLLENTKGGVVAGFGIVFLFWSVIKVLGNMERSFNDIWGIKKQRNLWRRFSDYLSFMLICPILFILASSMTIVVTSEVEKLLLGHTFFSFFAKPIQVSLRILPLFVIWGLFAFVYVFLPNGKVKLGSALLGGILAGTIYHVVQWAYLSFQIGINRYNAIYGSFAALPLFLVWLQLSWLIVLYGAEVCFAHQNVHTYEFEPDCLKISPAFRRLVTLAVAQLCVKMFKDGVPPPTAAEISQKLGTPIRLVNETLYDLTEADILSEVVGEANSSIAYQPGINIESLTIKGVIDRLDNRGVTTIPLARSEAVEKISTCLLEFRDKLAAVPENVLLKNL